MYGVENHYLCDQNAMMMKLICLMACVKYRSAWSKEREVSTLYKEVSAYG